MIVGAPPLRKPRPALAPRRPPLRRAQCVGSLIGTARWLVVQHPRSPDRSVSA